MIPDKLFSDKVNESTVDCKIPHGFGYGSFAIEYRNKRIKSMECKKSGEYIHGDIVLLEKEEEVQLPSGKISINIPYEVLRPPFMRRYTPVEIPGPDGGLTFARCGPIVFAKDVLEPVCWKKADPQEVVKIHPLPNIYPNQVKQTV